MKKKSDVPKTAQVWIVGDVFARLRAYCMAGGYKMRHVASTAIATWLEAEEAKR